MNQSQLWAHSPLLIISLGFGLFLISLEQHLTEFFALKTAIGPASAFVLDGLPALGLAYGGYRVFQTDSTPTDQRRIVLWSLSGGFIFMITMGATFLVRIIEGRVIAEPVFPLLVATEAGAIAGLIAGYYNARGRAEARRAQRVTNALAFVNDLIRHDLRNDLTVIQGHAELIDTQQPNTGGDSEGDSPTVIAEKAGEALIRIETTRAITDTLTGDPELEPVNLTEIIADLVTRFEATHNVTVMTTLPENTRVAANAGLRSVVDNLLENAIEHNDTNDPHIEVAVEPDADTIRMSISDSGPGIPDNQKTTLLNRNRTESGRGGLTLVQTLVEAYDGEIQIEDNEPQGSRFIVDLPRVKREP